MSGDALVIGLAKKVKPSGKANSKDAAEEEDGAETGDDGGDDAGSLDDVESSAAADLADAVGADSDKAGAIKDALRDFVEACVKRLKDGGGY